MKRHVSLGLFLSIAVALVVSACTGAAVAPAPPVSGGAGKGPSSGAAVPAWQQKWDQTLAAARKEGKVTVYGQLGPEAKVGLMTAFKAKYGIELEPVIAPDLEITTRYVEETRKGVHLADVIFGGATTLLNTVKPGAALSPLAPNLILPEIKETRVWRGDVIPLLDKDQTIIMSTLGRVFYAIFNSEMVKEGEITTFKDYLNPKWKGKIVMFDPTISGNTSTWNSLLLSRVMGEDEGRKYLRGLAEQQPTIIRDKRLPVEWTAKGRFPVHIGPNMQATQEFVKAGAPIKATREEVAFLNPSSSCFAMAGTPANPNAAIVLVNWLMTAEGQAIISKAWLQAAARADVPTTDLDPMTVATADQKQYLTDEAVTLYNRNAQKIAQEIFGHLMK